MIKESLRKASIKSLGFLGFPAFPAFPAFQVFPASPASPASLTSRLDRALKSTGAGMPARPVSNTMYKIHPAPKNLGGFDRFQYVLVDMGHVFLYLNPGLSR